jgi:hypothetical protein
VNLQLEERERITTGGKGRGENGMVIGMAMDAPITDSLGKKGMEHLVEGMAAGKMVVLPVVLDFVRSAEA